MQVPQEATAFTIEVKTWSFQLFSVEESPVGDRGEFTLALNGARLRPDTRVFLLRNGQRFEAVRTAFIDGSRIIALFDADPLEPGRWDVVARQPDGTEAVLPQALTVEPALPPGLRVTLEMPPVSRIDRRIPIQLRAENLANVNVERALVWMTMPPDMKLTLFDDFVHVDSLLHFPGPFVTPDGRQQVMWLTFSNIGPRQTKVLNGWLEFNRTGTYEFQIETFVTTTPEHIRIMATTWLEAGRQGWVSFTPTQTTPPLGKVLQEDCSALKGLEPSLYKLCLQDNARKEKVKDLTGIVEAGAKIPGTAVKPQRPGLTAPYHVGRFAYELYKTGEKWDDLDRQTAEAVRSQDPNDILGPAGYGDEHWGVGVSAVGIHHPLRERSGVCHGAGTAGAHRAAAGFHPGCAQFPAGLVRFCQSAIHCARKCLVLSQPAGCTRLAGRAGGCECGHRYRQSQSVLDFPVHRSVHRRTAGRSVTRPLAGK
ncbi:MAG: hypothetical protein Q9P14_12305 [candidate division KSB1 bacterium]|nr:hypothetical protein [candidate division KSB1 bacterium]